MSRQEREAVIAAISRMDPKTQIGLSVGIAIRMCKTTDAAETEETREETNDAERA